MSIRSVPSDLRDLARLALQAGWKITVTSKCHIRWESPEGKLVFSSGTPSDQRSKLNTIARLKRAGLCLGPQ